MSYGAPVCGVFIRSMMEPTTDETPAELIAAYYRIAMRAAQALLVIDSPEWQVHASDRWFEEPRDTSVQERVN